MTREEREEAISTLEYIKEYCHYEYEKEIIDKVQEALNQEPILDKIRAEIINSNEMDKLENSNLWQRWFLNLIDKYKAESEE